MRRGASLRSVRRHSQMGIRGVNSTEFRVRRRHRVLVALAVALLAIAICAAWPSHIASAMSAIGSSSADALRPIANDVATIARDANSQQGEERVRPSGFQDASANAAAQPEIAGQYRIRVRVVDDRGEAIRDATVRLESFRADLEPPLEWTATDGRATITASRELGPLGQLRVVAAVCGAREVRSLNGVEEHDEIAIVLRDVGRLEVVCASESGPLGGEVRARPFGDFGPFRLVAAADGASVVVGLGQQLHVSVWSGAERDSFEVAGPTRAHEVVRLACDLRRCTVRFQVDRDPSMRSAMLAALLAGGDCALRECYAAADGGWDAWVPRNAAARLVVMSGAFSYESPVMEFGESVDLGRIALEPMKDFGTVDARMPDGSLASGAQFASACVDADGRRLPASMATGRIVVAKATDTGTRIASLRMFSAVEVSPAVDGFYAEPSVVTLTGGTRAQVTMLGGADVEIASVDAGTLRTMALLHRATGERFHARESSLAEGRPQWKFLGLRPGDYDLLIDGMSSSPSTVHVPAGSKQRVAVTLTQK